MESRLTKDSYNCKKMIIYTVGHSTRTLKELLHLLKNYGIEAVVDVRRFPGSRKFPHFKREFLEDYLERNGIEYYWLGDLLGGYREGGYEKYMESEDFREGIKELLEIVQKRRTTIMCAELLWFRCHRRFISDELLKLGHRVLHILDEKRIYEHKLRGESPELF
jgi:uncharacterized protein (DUF488 family)